MLPRHPGGERSADGRHRAPAQLVRVAREPRLPACVPPEESEAGLVRAGDCEERVRAYAVPPSFGTAPQLRGEAIERALQHRPVKRLLRGEMTIDDELGDAGRRRDLFHRRVHEAGAPEVFLAAVSQRTTRIRLGHGIVQMPPPFNHPARVAERIATLDLVSGGRVDFGTGEASSEAELGGFRIDPGEKRAMWEEGLRVALRCLTEAPFTGHTGRYLTLPPRN